MNIARSQGRLPLLLVALAWVVIAGCCSAGLYLEYRLSEVGRHDLVATPVAVAVIFIAGMVSAGVVGSALIVRRPRHPVGWCFLALAVAVSSSAVLDAYGPYGAVARPGALPGAGLAATVGDITFISWLGLLALILLYTPSGRLESRPAWIAAWTAGGSAALAFAVGLVRPYRGVHLQYGIENPLEVSSLAGELAFVGITSIVILHLALLVGVIQVIARFWRAKGKERRQLRWLAFAAIPFPLLVVGAFIAATLDNETVLILAGCSFMTILPLAAILAIEQDHLYDVDRLVSRGLSYSLLTAVLVTCYVAVVLTTGQALGASGDETQAPAVVATLVTMSVALPARRRLQDLLDRRFNRRRYDAVAAVRRFVREPSPTVTIEQGLRNALHDPGLAIAYWIDERERWVDEQGNPVRPGDAPVPVERHGTDIAAVQFTDGRVDRRIVEEALAEALPEIENARLRAAIALQLVEVRESRARIVAAQLAERRKLERNLHDGAQQRLLAVALQLRAAEVGEDPARMHAAVDDAVRQLQLAVGDLRDIANGLHPVVLADGGLAAALDDLAARTPVEVRIETTSDRFPPGVEETAWFIVCEAVTNAVKHAFPASIAISAAGRDGHLSLAVEDDGCGHADPAGAGLRGITDRAEAAGGWLMVHDRPGGGTIVTAELPCASL